MAHAIFLYGHDYKDDTKIEVSKSMDGIVIKLSFTSEDPDYGTETLELVDAESVTKIEAIRGLREKITAYLDEIDEKHDPSLCVGYDIFGDYMRTSLYAFENALKSICADWLIQNGKENSNDTEGIEEG